MQKADLEVQTADIGRFIVKYILYMSKNDSGMFMKFIFFLCFSSCVFAQGLFESAQSTASPAYELGGEVRSGIRAGSENDSLYSKDLYVRSGLKLKIRAGSFAYAYTDLSFEYGFAGMENISAFRLREAYFDLQRGPFHVRLGKQIEAWGRTDAFSSADQLTAKDLRRAFIDPEDMCLANFLLNTEIRFGAPVHLQGLWIPVYRANEVPLSMFDLPENIFYDGMRAPARTFANSGAGLRLDLYTGEYDAAFSYLNAFGLQPAFSAEIHLDPLTGPFYMFYQLPWRRQLFAFDAAFNAGPWSFRFETSLMLPDSSAEEEHIPLSEAQWTLGVDRSLGALRFLAEYNGKYVPDYREAQAPQNPGEIINHQLAMYNRLLFRQSEKIQHQMFFRVSLSLFHDTFEIEFPFMYYLTTNEYVFQPLIRLELADALSLRLGAGFYKGDKNTLFDLTGHLYNGIFAELKLVF